MGERKTTFEVLAEWDRLMLEERFPHPRRLLVAMRLAPSLDVCRLLLAGEPVDPDRLDQAELFACKHRRLVRLDMAEIDLLRVA